MVNCELCGAPGEYEGEGDARWFVLCFRHAEEWRMRGKRVDVRIEQSHDVVIGLGDPLVSKLGTYSMRPAELVGSAPEIHRREMFDAVCATCGENTQVPFKPGDWSVYCPACYRKRKGWKPRTKRDPSAAQMLATTMLPEKQKQSQKIGKRRRGT